MANWCPKCKSVLANKQAEGERCRRCDSSVEQKEVIVFAGRGLTDVLGSGLTEDSQKVEERWYSERMQGISLGMLFACLSK